MVAQRPHLNRQRVEETAEVPATLAPEGESRLPDASLPEATFGSTVLPEVSNQGNEWDHDTFAVTEGRDVNYFPPAQANDQGYFLPPFHAPTRTVHHPKEIRFDPRHAIQAKSTSEVAATGGEAADRVPIGLINDN